MLTVLTEKETETRRDQQLPSATSRILVTTHNNGDLVSFSTFWLPKGQLEQVAQNIVSIS